MPAATEKRLKKRARKLYPHNEEKQNRYVYGTLTKIKKRHEVKLHRRKTHAAKATNRQRNG